MAKLRPKALDCPNCGASIEVRNAVRAKSVVCGHCTAQIDLTKPGFEVLGTIGVGREPPIGPLRLGLRGSIDGKTHEIIGRMRLRGSDDEESWFWDEWLLLSEDGAYRWLSEDPEKGWALHDSFVPDPPVSPAQLAKGAHVRIGDKRMLVRERDRARIDFIEGELTWRARIGDVVEYADASLGLHGYAFEWTADEFESFRTRGVTRPELWAAFGLGQHQPEATAHHERSQLFRRTAAWLMAGALAAFAVALVAPALKSKINRSDGAVRVTAADLDRGLQLAELELSAGLGFYAFQADVFMPRGMERYDIAIEGPGLGAGGTLLRFQHYGTSHDRESASQQFTVPEDGIFRIVLRGAAKEPAEDGLVTWAVDAGILAARWFVLAGVFLLAAAFYTFFRSRKEALIASSLYYGEE